MKKWDTIYKELYNEAQECPLGVPTIQGLRVHGKMNALFTRHEVDFQREGLALAIGKVGNEVIVLLQPYPSSLRGLDCKLLFQVWEAIGREKSLKIVKAAADSWGLNGHIKVLKKRPDYRSYRSASPVYSFMEEHEKTLYIVLFMIVTVLTFTLPALCLRRDSLKSIQEQSVPFWEEVIETNGR